MGALTYYVSFEIEEVFTFGTWNTCPYFSLPVVNICLVGYYYTMSAWNKNLTKETNSSVKKISDTMKEKKIDNFSTWRKQMKKDGKIKSRYPSLKKDGDLAELIGVVLGDGHVCVYDRTEELRIISNANNPGFVKRYATLVEHVFKKKPYIRKDANNSSVRIGLYEKYISKRIGIATGARKDTVVKVPLWIFKNKYYIVRYLRGLYEAEGSFSVHKPTYTYKFQFSNKNASLLKNVYSLMVRLGFHPHVSKNQVQISKKEEVYKAIETLKFRKYK